MNNNTILLILGCFAALSFVCGIVLLGERVIGRIISGKAKSIVPTITLSGSLNSPVVSAFGVVAEKYPKRYRPATDKVYNEEEVDFIRDFLKMMNDPSMYRKRGGVPTKLDMKHSLSTSHSEYMEYIWVAMVNMTDALDASFNRELQGKRCQRNKCPGCSSYVIASPQIVNFWRERGYLPKEPEIVEECSFGTRRREYLGCLGTRWHVYLDESATLYEGIVIGNYYYPINGVIEIIDAVGIISDPTKTVSHPILGLGVVNEAKRQKRLVMITTHALWHWEKTDLKEMTDALTKAGVTIYAWKKRENGLRVDYTIIGEVSVCGDEAFQTCRSKCSTIKGIISVCEMNLKEFSKELQVTV